MSLTLARLGAIASGFSSGPSLSSWNIIEPTSVSHTGTSASIVGSGEVTFTSVTSLYVNDVFTTAYKDYVMIFTAQVGTGQHGLRIRMSASGVANSATAYAQQYQQYYSSTKTGVSGTANAADFSRIGDEAYTSTYTMFYGPQLNQYTAISSFCFSGNPGITAPFLTEYAATHTVTAQYDGIQIYGESMSGALKMYGLGGEA